MFAGSVNDVTVVNVELVERCSVNPVSFEALSVHVREIADEEPATAAKADGAAGTAGACVFAFAVLL